MPLKDPKKLKEYERMRGKKNRKKLNKYQGKRYRDNLAWIRSIKEASGCTTCTEKDARCLDFHHVDPTTKSFTISNCIVGSRATLLKEIAKCIIVCSNCHRKLENPDNKRLVIAYTKRKK